MNIFNQKELKLSIETIANTQGIKESDVITILEDVFAVSVRQSFSKEHVIVAKINEDYSVDFSKEYKVIDDNHSNIDETKEKYSPNRHLYQDQAEEMTGKQHLPDDKILEPILDFKFSRLNVNVAKQQVKLRVKEYLKEQIREKFKTKANELVSVIIKSFDRNGYTVEYAGEYTGYLPNKNLFNNRERLKVGNRYQAIFDFSEENKNSKHGLCFSRSGENFVKAVLSTEIPDINNEIINIRNIYRDKGNKIIVVASSSDKNIDVIGSCVGIRGSRINNVMSHFSGESVDIIEWSSEPSQLITNILSKIQIKMLVEEDNSYVVIVDDSTYENGAVKNYQISALTSFLKKDVVIQSESDFETKNNELINYFAEQLNLDTDSADIIVQVGFNSIDQLLYQSANELADILEVDIDSAKMIQDVAKEKIEMRESEMEKIESDLKEMEYLDSFLIEKLVLNNVKDRESLAELDTFELVDILPVSEEKAGQIIMESRKVWEV